MEQDRGIEIFRDRAALIALIVLVVIVSVLGTLAMITTWPNLLHPWMGGDL